MVKKGIFIGKVSKLETGTIAKEMHEWLSGEDNAPNAATGKISIFPSATRLLTRKQKTTREKRASITYSLTS